MNPHGPHGPQADPLEPSPALPGGDPARTHAAIHHTAQDDAHDDDGAVNIVALFDPGWLFVVAGAAMMIATVLIPASDDLSYAHWIRDRALVEEAHRQERLDRYRDFLAALERREAPLMLSLAASQLNEIPADRSPIINPLAKGRRQEVRTGTASVFPSLEPPPKQLPQRVEVRSTLKTLATDPKYRPWVIIGSAVSILIGLLPPSRKARG